jgi:hypothetical protein
MATFSAAPQELQVALHHMLEKHHPDLKAGGVELDVLLAHGPRNKHGNLISPALKQAGYECGVLVQINSLKHRALGLGDVLILIDGDRWPDWTTRQRHAVLDHELEHIDVRWAIAPDFDDEDRLVGEPELDDLGRPKVSLRLHDWQIGGFSSIAERWGNDALEVQAMNAALDANGQYLLPYLDGIERSIAVEG